MVDYFAGTPLDEAIVGTDYNNASDTLSTDECGNVYFCVDPGVDVAMDFNTTGYWPTVYENIRLTQSFDFQAAPLFLSSLITSELEGTNVSPAVDITQPIVDVVVLASPDGGCPAADWTFQLEDMSGAPVASGGVVYFNGLSLQAGSGTTADGLAIFYNVDSSVGALQVIGSNAMAPKCVVTYDDYQLTGVVPVANRSISFYPYPITYMP